MGVFQPRRRPSASRSNDAPSASRATASNPTTPPALPRRQPHRPSPHVADTSPLVWVPSAALSTSPVPSIHTANVVTPSNPLRTVQATSSRTNPPIPPPKQTPPLQPSHSRAPPDLREVTDQRDLAAPQRDTQRDPPVYPSDFLDSLHRLANDQRIPSRHPSRRLVKLLEFLMRNRVPDSISFAGDCLRLYNDAYSRKMRTLKATRERHLPPHGATVEGPGQAQAVPQSATDVNGGEVGMEPAYEARNTPEVITIPGEVQSVPVIEIKEESPSLRREPIPKITSPMFSGRESLSGDVRDRWKQLINSGKDFPPRKSEDEKYHCIWKGKEGTIRLPVDYCRSLKMLHDKSGELCEIHLDALRYLWHYMIADTCAGAVFNPPIGYPSSLLVLTFCYLVNAQPQQKHKRIVIFCPQSSINRWKAAARCCRGVSVSILQSGTWAQDAERWNEQGGVLLCPFDVYRDVLYAPSSSTEQRAATIRLICRPGPSIVILDEASRLLTLQPALRRSLNRIKTKSRLALTNLPRINNMVPFWSIIDWAVPEFLGSLEEYLRVFLSKLIHCNVNTRCLGENRQVSPTEKGLEMMFQYVVYEVDGETQNRGVESSRGHKLRETTIFLKLSPVHREIYDDIAKLVLASRKKGELSNYVAMHVLLLASTSILALLQLLCTRLDNEEPQDEIARKVPCVQAVFKKLHKVIQKNVMASIKYAKFEAMIRMCDATAQSNGKLVILCAMPEVQKEVIAAIQANCTECEVFICDLLSAEEARNVQINNFNKCTSGAVLLAPVGFAVDFCEEAGWGALHSSHILVLESLWNETATSQGINRVYNFSTKTDVHVYFLSVVGTIDDILIARWKRRHTPSLLLPHVSDAYFEREVQVPGESLEPDYTDNYLAAVSSLPEFHRIERTSGRHLIGSVNRGCISKDDEYRAELDVTNGRIEYFQSLPKVVDAVQELSYGANLYEALRDTRVYRAYSMLSSKNGQSSNSFLSLWNEHFCLYEQDHISGYFAPLKVQTPDGPDAQVHGSERTQPAKPTSATSSPAFTSHKRSRPVDDSTVHHTLQPYKRRTGAL